MTETLSFRVHNAPHPAPHSPLCTSFRGSEAITLVSAANPAKRIAAEKEEQGSERSFRREAEAESSGLCDDAIPLMVPPG